MKKKTKLKPKLTYELIPESSDVGRPMYAQLYEIIDAHHEELSRTQVRIALAWATSWKRDVDGHLVLGKCKKANALDRELAPYDFVILLNRDFWLNGRVDAKQRSAILDHELCHAAIAYDQDGEPKVDAKGRTMYRIKKHDLEEFEAIVTRHGCYKRDIESFMQAIVRAEHRASTSWVGYTTLSDQLKALGFTVPPTVIATWPDDERREVSTWALLRSDPGVKAHATLSVTIPPCLAAAVQELGSAAASENTTH